MTGSTTETARQAELAERLSALRTRLARAARSAGRDVAEIQFLPVTKYFPVRDILILRRLGCGDFGESREQEASNKAAEIAANAQCGESATPIRWHMIGRVQRNKARAVAGWAYAVHSVDSMKVAAALERGSTEALAGGRRLEPVRVYVQVSLDGDAERGGVDVGRQDLVDELCAAVDRSPGLQLVGLMGVPPLGAEPGAAFARLAEERRRVQLRYQQRLGLSAGMSGDLEAAVEHGSTCVRVGTALMGPRPLTSP